MASMQSVQHAKPSAVFDNILQQLQQLSEFRRWRNTGISRSVAAKVFDDKKLKARNPRTPSLKGNGSHSHKIEFKYLDKILYEQFEY